MLHDASWRSTHPFVRESFVKDKGVPYNTTLVITLQVPTSVSEKVQKLTIFLAMGRHLSSKHGEHILICEIKPEHEATLELHLDAWLVEHRLGAT